MWGRFYATVGPKLEYLRISGACSSQFLAHVRKHCRNLHELRLYFVATKLDSEIANLASSYATQLLKFTNRPCCIQDQFQLKDIAEKCPYAYFSLFAGGRKFHAP